MHPQLGIATLDLVTAVGPDSADDVLLGLAGVVPLLPAELSIAAFMSGIQRIKGVKSATSTMYQLLRTESHRAPSAFALSLSAKGVTKLILMLGIISWSHQSIECDVMARLAARNCGW